MNAASYKVVWSREWPSENQMTIVIMRGVDFVVIMTDELYFAIVNDPDRVKSLNKGHQAKFTLPTKTITKNSPLSDKSIIPANLFTKTTFECIQTGDLFTGFALHEITVSMSVIHSDIREDPLTP